MTAIPFIASGETFAVIDKPAGLVVDRSGTAHKKTLADYLHRRRFLEKNYRQEKFFWQRQGIVHRLDKDASGLLLLARSPTSFAFLQQQFRRRRVVKKYLVLVWGELPAAGKITFPLARTSPRQRYPVAVSSQGKTATTLFWRRKLWRQGKEALSLAAVQILTGRTHQIRAHFRYLGFPVWGDKIYGRRTHKEKEIIERLPRLFLHAYYLRLLVAEGEERGFKIGLPKDLRKVILLLDQKWQCADGKLTNILN